MIRNSPIQIAGLPSWLKKMRVAFLCNAGSIFDNGQSVLDALLEAGVKLTCLLSPEHGLTGQAEAGEVVHDCRDAGTGLPCCSLYGSHKDIPEELFSEVDAVLIDLPDVGVRYYTYPDTCFKVMEQCASSHKPVVILDRANPLGNKTEGPVLNPSFASPVGRFPVPVRHGLTLGEYAQLAVRNWNLAAGVELTVVPGTSPLPHDSLFPDYRQPWMNPSPNLRSFEALLAYVGTCLIEGTNVSEGRGTDKPFLQIGAPWKYAVDVVPFLQECHFPGISLIPAQFTPASGKHAGMCCHGVELCITDFREFPAFDCGVKIVEAFRRLCPEQFQFRAEHFDHLFGDDSLRLGLA